MRERLTGLRRIDPTAVDTGFALLVAFGTCLAGSQYHDARWPHFDAPAYLFSVLACLPMALRRRIPLLALALSCAAFAGYLAAGYQPSINWFAPPLILYTVVALRPLREAAAGAVLTGAVIFYSGWCADLPPAVIVVQPIVLVGIAWLLGGGARALADRNRRLAVLTARLRDEQRDRAARAVTEERVRIARELHDVVAHHMSVITVQAGLAQYVFAADPATARTALDVIADAGRQAQQEMRYLLAALRIGPEQPGDEAPAPGAGRLPELVGRVRAAGLPVELSVTGEPRPLPPHLDLCVYRVVQEALTNVLKHAGPARAAVTVEYRDAEVVARVVDDGATAAVPSAEASGHGLIGMRERGRLYGGTLSAGPRPGNGFEVLLTLPVGEVVQPG